jgi:hypothetical protein
MGQFPLDGTGAGSLREAASGLIGGASVAPAAGAAEVPVPDACPSIGVTAQGLAR